MADQDVWDLIYNEEAAQKAQNLIASVYRLDDDPSVYATELKKVTTWLIEPASEEEFGARLVWFVSALAILARMPLDIVADSAVRVRSGLSLNDDTAPDPVEVRNLAFDLLNEYARSLHRKGTPPAE